MREMKRAGRMQKRRQEAMRQGVLSALLSLMLALAPFAVSATHGPGAVVEALQTAAADAVHGHSHSSDAAAHDATDHEHLVSGLLPGEDGSFFLINDAVALGTSHTASGLPRDGPRRPPRGFTV